LSPAVRIRGGILDVFSFSNEHPTDLELFGKEIEKHQPFDPEFTTFHRNCNSDFTDPKYSTGFSKEAAGNHF